MKKTARFSDENERNTNQINKDGEILMETIDDSLIEEVSLNEDSDDVDDTIDAYNEKKGGNLILLAFAVLIVAILAAIVLMISKWNKGVASDYDPNEDTSEFDVETNDYIQPLSSTDLDGKIRDGQITILTLGNSPFADNGKDNNLCKALADRTGAMVINGSIPGSMMSQQSESLGECDSDGVSLYQVADALTTGDFNRVLGYGERLGEDSYNAAKSLMDIDMTKIDCIVIMYDLNDYLNGRPTVNIYETERVTTVGGSLSASLKMFREAFPYIRIVVMSAPACGFTADGYYVDVDKIDMGGGAFSDYMGQEIASCAANGVSFVDLYYGAINIDNRDQYIYDDYHINDDGAKVIADRFASLITLAD